MSAIAAENVSKHWTTAEGEVRKVAADEIARRLAHHRLGRVATADGRLQVFSSTEQGIDWSIITAATLLTTAPLLIAFLLFQKQFVQSFMRAGVR